MKNGAIHLDATGPFAREASVDTRYDPTYDPLVSPGPGQGKQYAPTYWAATAGAAPPDDGPVTQDIDVDVAIIGGGYTGLAAALFLAREHGIKAVVLEANKVSWGCTSRNGGQGQNASGRLSRSQWIERWGKDVALKMHHEIYEGFNTFKSLVAEIDCDPQPGGHFLIAHRPRIMQGLAAESKVWKDVFGYPSELLGADAFRREFVNDSESAGALHEPEGIGVHPLKLAYGYLRLARQHGAKVHPGSPVIGWETINGVHHLRTPGGTVRARAVGIATGAYTAPGLHRSLTSKIMPILSNSMVTRPLTPAELEACNFRTTQVLTDTRTLRFYYRLLPDNRVQIGSRSAITGADAPNPRHFELLKNGLHRKFPALRGIADRLFVVGLGRRQPRHDAARLPARSEGDGVLRARLRRQRRIVFVTGRTAACRAHRRQGRAADAADLHVAAAGPHVRAVPAPRTADALPLVLPARRKAIDAQPVSSPT